MGLRTGASLIRLDDGTLVEVEVPEPMAISISSNYAQSVNSTLGSIAPIMHEIVGQVIKSLHTLPDATSLTKAEIEFGIKFDYEGSVYIARSRTDSNIAIKLTLEAEKKIS